MEPLSETIELDIEESNELAFKIKMEGAATSPAKVRLVCEGQDVAYMFSGYGTGESEVVQFTLPRMTEKLEEGTYQARVEVLVENRYFAPLHFQINFKRAMSVVAESIQVVQKPAKPDIKVSAGQIQVIRPQLAAQPIRVERRPEPVVQKKESTTTAPPSSKSTVFSTLRESYANKSKK